MKVILTADVKSLGKKGEIVDVSDGYARNMLLPKKLGVEANSKNINDLKLQKANEDKVAKEILEQAKALAAEIAEKSVTVSIKVGEGEKPSVLSPAKRSPRQPKHRSIWNSTRRRSSFPALSVRWV